MKLPLYPLALTLTLGVTLGAALVHFNLPPYGVLVLAKDTAEDLIENRQAYLGNAPVNQLIRPRYDGEGVTVLDEERVAPGNTLLAGVKGDAVALWLVSPQGETIRQWQPLTTEILSNLDYIEGVDRPFNDFFVTIHGAALAPDGGVIFTIANYVLVKLGACGDVDWVVPTMAHHSVFASYDDTYWSTTRTWHDEPSADFPQFQPPFWEDEVVQVDSEGNILQIISMLELIDKNRLWGMLFGGQLPTPVTTDDVLHLNDVEVLSPEFADAYPDFDAGDIMVSLRNPNLVIVFDPETLEAKWSSAGPWIRQHDPDFGADGKIVVLDNRNDDANGAQFGGSQIVLMTPSAPLGGNWDVSYENSDTTPFFTAKRGVVDLPGNGNVLVTESEAGRVFEFTPRGDIVWEYINRYDADHLTSVMHAERYPLDYASNAYDTCK
ncbi:arylsulfotransferase family protein [bacterium]|nr:arylsulfotransferase family protein [bacterium]